MVKAIPDDYPRCSPYLSIDGAADAITFYTSVFGAQERMRVPGPEGKVGHAELTIGDSLIMLSDEFPEEGTFSPGRLGGTPVTLSIYVEDVDSVHQAALDAGATEVSAVQDQFYGDRIGTIQDPFGHRWHIATHIEDITAEQMAERAAELTG